MIAILGILMALMLPAVQGAREAGRRTQCMNQLRQLGIAANSYASAMRIFPPGVNQWFFNSSVTFRGIPLFVYLLPYMEENALFAAWHIRRSDAQCQPGEQLQYRGGLAEPRLSLG